MQLWIWRKGGYILVVLLTVAAATGAGAERWLVKTPEALRTAVAEANPGAVIRLSAGIWRGVDLRLEASGRPGAPVVVAAEDPGGTILTGPTAIRIGGRHIELRDLVFREAVRAAGAEGLVVLRGESGREARDCRLTGLVFEDCNPEDPLENYPWIRLYGKGHRVDHCRFREMRHMGRMIQVRVHEPEPGHRIDHNHFADRHPGAESNGYEVIQIGLSKDSMKVGGVIVEKNLFERCDGETEIISSKSFANGIRDNLFLESSGTVTLRHGDNSVVEGNAFVGNGKAGTGGVRVIGSGHVVRKNTFTGLAGRTGGVIVLYCGIPGSPLNGYFPAHGAVVEGNHFHGNGGNDVYLNGGYGRRNRILLPETVSLRDNRFGLPATGGTVAIAGNLPDLALSGNRYASGVELGLAAREGLEPGECPPPGLPPGVPLRRETGPAWAPDLPGLLLLQGERIGDLAAGRPGLHASLRENLMERAAKVLGERRRYSVTFNDRVPPSGNKHDYYSTGPYWWPNPETEDGLPYVRRDGEFNPERDRVSDREPLHAMVRDVRLMAVAHAVGGERGHAEWGAELLRTWFLDPATRMRPNLNHAQAIPGRTEGRGTGIIDSHPFAELTDAILLLEHTGALTRRESSALRVWFTAFTDWLLESENGRDERASRNNHGTAYDLQLTALLWFTGQRERMEEYLLQTTLPRIGVQIRPDGTQPLELARTRTWSYCTENLEHFFKLGRVARKAGIDLFHYRTADGAGLRPALDYLLPSACAPGQWPHPQETAWQHHFIRNVLSIAVNLYPEPRYKEALDCVPGTREAVMPFLLRR